MEKYVFPKNLPESPKVKSYSKFEVLGFLINMSKNRIPLEMYEKWSNLVKKDLSLPEMHSSGVIKTKYGLKKDRDIYKKNRQEGDQRHLYR